MQVAQQSDDFWKDLKRAENVNKDVKKIEQKLKTANELTSKIGFFYELSELLQTDDDQILFKQFTSDLKNFSVFVENIYLTTLLKGKYDSLNAILTIHSGAGGTESQDWAQMLFRMYNRYAERNGFKLNVIDNQDGEVVGIKSISFEVLGENAYGYLKSEKGVHRLVRISPFDSNSRRHTSFASVEVMPEIESDTDVEINSADLKIDTYRSGGAGGQHVNKTDSAVRITHLPSGIVVGCQSERSQIQNRENALKILKSKLVQLKEEEEAKNLNIIRGEIKKIEWGSQIRSYIFCPYTLVKDHRTEFETPNIADVMDGNLQDFINEYLKKF